MRNLRIPHDANWLSEAVFNLLDNSIKYSSSSSYVDMKAEVNEMFAEISVTDSGMGIEQGEENLIFQRFYRGKKVTSQEGFGLGLYLAREIVLQHQGFMKAQKFSSEGRHEDFHIFAGLKAQQLAIFIMQEISMKSILTEYKRTYLAKNRPLGATCGNRNLRFRHFHVFYVCD